MLDEKQDGRPRDDYRIRLMDNVQFEDSSRSFVGYMLRCLLIDGVFRDRHN